MICLAATTLFGLPISLSMMILEESLEKQLRRFCVKSFSMRLVTTEMISTVMLLPLVYYNGREISHFQNSLYIYIYILYYISFIAYEET